MHPAPSVIVFTVLSGAGFGYLFFLGLGLTLGTGAVAFWQFALGFALAVGGLIFSTFHLGNPQRALLAFTQWRTSWLSREAWASVAALLVMGLHALGVIFWGAILWPLGLIGAALCMATVFATSMIYAQMTTVPRWNTRLTPAYFLLAALAGGAILTLSPMLSILLLLALGFLQLAVWRRGDARFAQRGHSVSSATGLGAPGRVGLFESPHTSPNYLLHEFGFEVGRRHAARLRILAILGMSVLPAILLLIWPAPVTIALAFVLHLGGSFASRWLFFAEAEHVVQLYYGREAA